MWDSFPEERIVKGQLVVKLAQYPCDLVSDKFEISYFWGCSFLGIAQNVQGGDYIRNYELPHCP